MLRSLLTGRLRRLVAFWVTLRVDVTSHGGDRWGSLRWLTLFPLIGCSCVASDQPVDSGAVAYSRTLGAAGWLGLLLTVRDPTGGAVRRSDVEIALEPSEDWNLRPGGELSYHRSVCGRTGTNGLSASHDLRRHRLVR